MRKCTVTNCHNKLICKGFCHKHYWRFRRTGDPLKTPTNGRGRIKITLEQEQSIIKSYCNGTGKFAGEISRELGVNSQVVTNCLRRNGIKVTRRWCSLKGEKNHSWRGGRRKSGKYVSIYMPSHPQANNKYVLEHRLMMEEKLGRYLLPEEVVNHKDGNTLNNNIDNLELFQNNGEHIKYHIPKFNRNSRGVFIKK